MTRTESRLAARLATALRVYEKNECHNPAGSPAGGQFCGRGGAAEVPPGDLKMGTFDADGGWTPRPREEQVTATGRMAPASADASAQATLNPGALTPRIVATAHSLIKQFGQGAFERAGNWYLHRQREQSRFAAKIGMERHLVCGAAAALSPQTAWKTNWRAAMGVCNLVKSNSEVTFSQEWRDLLYKNTKTYVNPIDIQSYVGKKVRFNDLDPALAARIWPTIPRGSFGFANMEKAIQIARGAEPGDILGGFKVRNFYNNMLDPGDRRFVTVDTHAIRLMTGDLTMSNSEKGSLGQRFFGNARLYGLAHAAWSRAADEFGMTPNQFQAATWILWRRRWDKSEVGKRMNAEERAALRDKMKGREYEYNLDEAWRGLGPRLRAAGGAGRLRELAQRLGHVYPSGDCGGAPDLVSGAYPGGGRAPAGGGTGRGLTEMARASGGTATSRQGKLVAPSTAPVTGPRASRRNFIRKVATILARPPKTARLPRAAAPTAAKAPVGLLKPKRVG